MLATLTGSGSGVTCFAFTVITSSPDTPLPSFAVALMVAVPAAFAVIRPASLTFATVLSELVHVTSLLSAFSGNTAAAACIVSPTVSSVLSAVTLMLATLIGFGSGVSLWNVNFASAHSAWSL